MAYGGSQARGRIRAVVMPDTTDTAMLDPNHVCNLHHSSQQRQILNPLSEARDQTRVLKDTSQVRSPLSHDGNSWNSFLLINVYKRVNVYREFINRNYLHKKSMFLMFTKTKTCEIWRE